VLLRQRHPNGKLSFTFHTRFEAELLGLIVSSTIESGVSILLCSRDKLGKTCAASPTSYTQTIDTTDINLGPLQKGLPSFPTTIRPFARTENPSDPALTFDAHSNHAEIAEKHGRSSTLKVKLGTVINSDGDLRPTSRIAYWLSRKPHSYLSSRLHIAQGLRDRIIKCFRPSIPRDGCRVAWKCVSNCTSHPCLRLTKVI
jgi:hypothetical protein